MKAKKTIFVALIFGVAMLVVIPFGLMCCTSPVTLVSVEKNPSATSVRQADIKTELERLISDNRNNPADDMRAHDLMETIGRDKGVNSTGFLFPYYDLDAIIANIPFDDKPHFADGVTTIDAIVDFDRYLKAHGIDLIVLPVPSAAQVYGYKLDGGFPRTHQFWPEYTKGMIELLKQDVEVMEITDDFRDYTGPTAVLTQYDHHWDSAGIMLAAGKLADRLKRRYKFASSAGDKEAFTVVDSSVPTSVHLFYDNKLLDPKSRPWPEGVAKDHPIKQVLMNGQVCPLPKSPESPILLVGDSCGFHLHHWGGSFSQHLSRDLGFLVADMTRGGCVWPVPQIYAADLADRFANTKVVVFITRAQMLAPGGQKWGLASAVTGARKFVAGDGQVTLVGKVTDVSAVPPTGGAYKDAITACKLKVLSVEKGQYAEKDVLVYAWVMKDRKHISPGADLKVGMEFRLTLTPWSAATERQKELTTIRRCDDVLELELPPMWAETMEQTK